MGEDETRRRRQRWRLVLGPAGEQALGGLGGGELAEIDRCVEFLYGREYGDERNVRSDGPGSLAPSALTVPEWINRIHELFPRETIERLERDALERYELDEMVTNPELLKRAQPSTALLKAVLQTKHLMNQAVLSEARNLVRKVVRELMEQLARPVVSPFLGSLDRRRRSPLRIARNFDARETIRANLAHWSPEEQRLYIQRPIFLSRVRRHIDRWQVIICVDESGSMLDSVIHSAITAAIFHGIRHLKTHTILFDTSVVDVTADCADPVETIMQVQLGGGTDIGKAVGYSSTLVENPRRTILVLITDFYEGADERVLLAHTHRLCEAGVTFLGLAALDDRAMPQYDKRLAQKMVELGAHVGAMTPGALAEWVAEKVR